MAAIFQSDIQIPSLPKVIQECISHIYNPKIDLDILIHAVEKDAEVVAKLLRLANSVHYSLFKETNDIKVAVTRVGINPLTQILITQFFNHNFKGEDIDFFSVPKLVKHALWASQIAFELGKHLNIQNPVDLLIAGLLHDIGLLGKYYKRKDWFKKITQRCINKNISFHAAEIELKTVCHCQEGGNILKTWKLFDNITFLVGHHHCFRNTSYIKENFEHMKLFQIQELSNKIAHRINSTFKDYEADKNISQMELDTLGLTSTNVEKIMKIVIEHVLPFV